MLPTCIVCLLTCVCVRVLVCLIAAAFTIGINVHHKCNMFQAVFEQVFVEHLQSQVTTLGYTYALDMCIISIQYAISPHPPPFPPAPAGHLHREDLFVHSEVFPNMLSHAC